MFGFSHFFRTVQAQDLIMAIKVRHRHKQIQWLIFRQKQWPSLARRHGVQRVEQELGKNISAKGWRKPARADKARQFCSDFLLRFFGDGPFNRTPSSAQYHPCNWRGPKFGEAR